MPGNIYYILRCVYLGNFLIWLFYLPEFISPVWQPCYNLEIFYQLLTLATGFGSIQWREFCENKTLRTDMNELTDDLESEAAILNQWFYENLLVLNGDKSKLTTFKANRSNLEESEIQINGSTIIERKNVKLLGVTLDHQLRLEEHIKVFCKEARKKVDATNRIAS